MTQYRNIRLHITDNYKGLNFDVSVKRFDLTNITDHLLCIVK